MHVHAETLWSPADFCTTATAPTDAEDPSPSALAASVYDRVCRTNFNSPGFCLIDLGANTSSQWLRRLMVALKRQMDCIHRSRAGRALVFLSVGRFDQQVTTKPHRDGGPDECFLMLGYEPSHVPAELAISDYSKCAHDMGLTPSEILENHNPMFAAGEQLLQPYTTRVSCFSNRSFQILLINNSIAPYSQDATSWQGVLHTATIQKQSDVLRRVVNSTMI